MSGGFYALSEATRTRLATAGLDADDVARLVREAVREDLGGGLDVTSWATVDPAQRSRAAVATRRAGTIAGVPVALAVLEAVCDPAHMHAETLRDDGARVTAGDVVVRVEAPTIALLTAERSMLNLLCHLSGVATLTRAWADALGSHTRVRDTRKTTPGLRSLEKYAVRCGGGLNHRMGLWDAALVKDNHVVAAGGLERAFERVRERFPDVPLEVEVDSLDGLSRVLACGADLVLLDNFTIAQMADAVAVRDRSGSSARLEASGGLTLADAAAVGATGVDYVAVGELTHSARILDLGLDFTDV